MTQTALAMQRNQPTSPQEAFAIAHEAGKRTRDAMMDIGGVMPEDMPVPDSITAAAKRLAINTEALPKAALKAPAKKAK